ncbi:AAA family ATPase [Salibaculum halophilum]|uniref:AAA family ATPase n=1 Tax=Salibaculum halophilum TaxID=1914408 RepID=UPI000A1201A9|nr:AAA family ATPase [Salibaculum halophilum]
MAGEPFLLTRLDSDIPHRSDISSRLREHLMRLRGHEIDDTVEIWDDTTGAVSEHDLTRIHRRATAYVDRLRAASGTAHLKPDEKARLAAVKDGVRATTITTEARADEIAAGLHAQMPWMAPATENAWHAMRRCAQEGAPVFRLPPMIMVGPPGIGKSHWARALAAALGVPSTLVDAAAEAASFVVAGMQRGWANAGPGKPLDTILNHRVLNPIVIVDELEKAGAVRDTSGTRHNLTEALLALMEPKTAARWECPFYRVPFDMSGIGWIMTANSRRGLPEPLLSRCPPLVLQPLTLSDLIGFAQREGAARGLTAPALDAIIETLQHHRDRADALSLRVVQRMLDRAEQLERRPVLN